MGFEIHGALQKLFNTHVAYGSTATDLTWSRDVRFYPETDQIAAPH